MTKWKIDPDHSVAEFAVRHAMLINVRGLFGKITGTILFEPPDIKGLSAEVEIDVASITTGNKKRDEHLLSADFFDVAKHPRITFRSTGIEQSGAGRAKVTGDLTIHGITRSVTFEAEYFGPVKNPFGEELTIGFFARTSLNRGDFGITWDEAMPEGGTVVGKDVSITLEIEADRAD